MIFKGIELKYLTFFICVQALLFLTTARVWAEYPDRPIKLIVPANPGGMADSFARIFQRALGDILPEPIVVINIEGAGGMIASRRVKTSRPDGYTIGIVNSSLLISKALGTADYGIESFEPVAQIATTYLGLAVGADAPYTSLKDLAGAAEKRKDTPMTMSTNIGSTAHLGCLAIADEGGFTFRYVHTGAGAKRLTSLLGGHTESTMLAIPEFKPYLETKEMKVLALLAEERFPGLEDIPTAIEQGFNTVAEVPLWLIAPKGTPGEHIQLLARAFRDAMQQPEVQKQYVLQASLPKFLEGQEFQEKLKREVDFIDTMVEKHGMRHQ